MPFHEKAGQEKIRSRTFGNVCSEGFYIVPSLCSTVCGKCLGVSDPAWSLISCLTHLTANNVDCSQTHWVCEWVTFSTWLPLLFFLPQALNLVCVWLFMCVSVVNHCVWDVQKEIKEVFLLLYTHTLLVWFKAVFVQLLILPFSFSPPPWWLSLFPATIFCLRLSLEKTLSLSPSHWMQKLPSFQTDTYSDDYWSTCSSLLDQILEILQLCVALSTWVCLKK